MIIYVVTSGEYSSCKIVGVYATPEKAAEAKDVYNASRIEEFELDKIPPYPPGKRFFEVSMKRDGAVQTVTHLGIDDYRTDQDWDVYPEYEEYDRLYRATNITRSFSFYLWAESEEAAVKIANEKRLACILDGRWTGDYQQDLLRWKITRGKEKPTQEDINND